MLVLNAIHIYVASKANLYCMYSRIYIKLFTHVPDIPYQVYTDLYLKRNTL